jgi:hypothetical protein
MEKDKILDRIKKLLTLASSSNEHEARAAADKANELLVRHNLMMQDVTTYGEEEYVEHKHPGHFRLPNDKGLLLILMHEHFFIHVVIGKPSLNTLPTINFLGKKSNIEVANYVYPYLLRAMRRGFLARKQAGLMQERDRLAYSTGFVNGLTEQLVATRKKTEASMAMVVVKDPKLTNFVRELHPRTTQHNIGSRKDWATEHGLVDGRNTKIQKGITEGPTESGRFLPPGN